MLEYIFNNKVADVVPDLLRFFKEKNITFYKIEQEIRGVHRYLNVTVSIKLDEDKK